MLCSRCRARAASGKKFCGDCGSPLPWACGACGSENTPRSRFCGDCGAPYPSAGTGQGFATEESLGPGEAERRNLTVVFADLVNSTGLGVRLDPEDYRDVMDAWRSSVTGMVARYGGVITRHMGDGVMAFFGYPRAHEADAERAVRAGLAIIEAVRLLDTVAGPPGTLATRVGLATGLVIVGDLIGAGSSLEWSVVGETPNLAARLLALAQHDMLVIDQMTHRLTGDMFDLTALPPARLKGIPGPVRSWVVLRESAVQSRFRALRVNSLPMINREEEIALLYTRWLKAREGSGSTVMLVGDSGLGKSRLIAALEEKLGDAPRSVMRWFCSPHYQDTPLYPVIRYFETAACFQRSDSLAVKSARLWDLLSQTATLGSAEWAALSDLLAVPLDVKLPAHQSLRSAKELTFNAVLRHAEELSTGAPLLISVEDIHWADPTTIALLERLVELMKERSALLVISTRPEKHLAWSTHPQITTRILNGLNRDHAEMLVKHVVGRRVMGGDVIARVVDRAAGIPLFIEELTLSLLETAPTTTPDPAPPAGPRRLDTVPTSLTTLLMAKLDQLGPGKEVAHASSVIGREFSFEMLRAVSDLPADRLERSLATLIHAGLIVPDGPAPEAMYVFRHALIQDAAYMSMLRDRRRTFHLRYAEALERDTSGPASTAPELLAAHFSEAGVAEKSADYYLKAAGRATGRFALTEIVGYLQKGLDQLKLLPPSVASQRRELELQVALGRALMEHRSAGDEAVQVAFERAHELCVSLGDDSLLTHVHDGLINCHFAHSDLDRVVEYAERTLELGARLGNDHAIVLAHRSSGHARLLLGQFREARRDLAGAMGRYEGGLPVARDPKVSVGSALGICLTALGLPDSGTAICLDAVRHADALDHPVTLNLGLRRACVQAMMRRDQQQVLALAERLLINQADYETFRGNNEGVFFLTWARLQSDRDLGLLEQLSGILDSFAKARILNLLTFFMTAASEAMLNYGELESANSLLDRAADLVDKTSERWCLAEINRLRAKLARDPQKALSLLESSVTLAREQGAFLWEARATTDWAKLLMKQEQVTLAADILRPLAARITEGANSPDFRAVLILNQELATASPAAEGSTNTEVIHALPLRRAGQ